MLRRPLFIFVVAFALGVLSALTVVRWQQAAQVGSADASVAPPASAIADATTSAPPDTPDKEDNGSGDHEDDESSADADAGASWPSDAGSPEQVLYAQGERMDAAIANLTPRVSGKVNLYLVAFAGDGNENVFRNEVEYVEKQFVQRFDAAGHTLILVNNPATLNDHPIASQTNLETAVDAIAEVMDKEEDLLFVFLTSHGSREHELAVELDPLPLDRLKPEDLAGLLAGSHIRNKVVVISACYSGGFIDALKGPTTMVITAARADRTSFGCGSKSDITYFGRAMFVDGLNDQDNFHAAFSEAAKLVRDWETKAGEQHSEPQIATAPAIEQRLKAWRSGLHLGPPVPFIPAADPKPANASPELSAGLTTH